MTSVAEERRFNPRPGGDIGDADFVGHMDHLGLLHPKLIDIAVRQICAAAFERPRANRIVAKSPAWPQRR